jgi:hypothetical protein
MDVDLTEQAAVGGSDALDIVGTIQLILDRVAAQTAPRNQYGDQRSVIWVPVTSLGECQSPEDTGILVVSFARFFEFTHQFVFYGFQHTEADLSFQLMDCLGRVIMRYPSNGAQYASASFNPYFISVSGIGAVLVLANAARSNTLSSAAVVAAVNSYGPLQANIGSHDPTAMRELALFRLVGNIPGKDVPPPKPGTVSSILQRCRFFGQPGGHIALTCPGQVR